MNESKSLLEMTTAELFVWDRNSEVDRFDQLTEWCVAVNNDVAASGAESLRAYAKAAAAAYNKVSKSGKVSDTFFLAKVTRAVRVTVLMQSPKTWDRVSGKYVKDTLAKGEVLTLGGLVAAFAPAPKAPTTNPIVARIAKVDDVAVLDAIIAAATARKAALAAK